MTSPSETIAFARRLRRKATHAEKILWILLRDRDLAGYKFRRQQPIGLYFADFACLRLQVVIECDGITHLERVLQDAIRDAYMVDLGWRVLRFSDARLIGDPDRVLAEIAAALQRFSA